LDCQAESDLYSPAEGRKAVDLLCGNALAAALEFSGRGIDVTIGYTGGKIRGGNAVEMAGLLAWPAALPMNAALDLPAPPESRPPSRAAGIIILALPRSLADSGEPSALDRFLKNRRPNQNVDLLFIYDEKSSCSTELEESAEICAVVYGRKLGVYARHCGSFKT
jgi:hypothetical protein